jgi:ABC-type phosphonate transport system ATPase subunit
LKLAQEWTATLDIKAAGPDMKVIELSGGNQQKVVISKSLVQSPKIIFFDEPTRGVDVGAIAEIHQLINGLADRGLAYEKGTSRGRIFTTRSDRGKNYVCGRPLITTRHRANSER